MTLNEFLNKNPEWLDLHIVIEENGTLKVIPAPKPEETRLSGVAEPTMFGGPIGL